MSVTNFTDQDNLIVIEIDSGHMVVFFKVKDDTVVPFRDDYSPEMISKIENEGYNVVKGYQNPELTVPQESREDIPVCDNCGWYMAEKSSERISPTSQTWIIMYKCVKCGKRKPSNRRRR